MSSKDSLKKLKKNQIKVFGLSSGITLGFIAILGGFGYLIDVWFGTKPFGLIIGLIISYPLNQIYLIKKVKKIK